MEFSHKTMGGVTSLDCKIRALMLLLLFYRDFILKGWLKWRAAAKVGECSANGTACRLLKVLIKKNKRKLPPNYGGRLIDLKLVAAIAIV